MKTETLYSNLDSLKKQYTDSQIDTKKLMMSCVQLGMQYQEEKIKEGINIVFTELHK